jgi:hypothetical protein
MEQALAHPYMHELHDIEDEPVADQIFDFGFEKEKLTLQDMRNIVVQESLHFKQATSKPQASSCIPAPGGGT